MPQLHGHWSLPNQTLYLLTTVQYALSLSVSQSETLTVSHTALYKGKVAELFNSLLTGIIVVKL